MNPDVELVDRIVASLEWQIRLNRWDGEKYQFAPYPASWLNAAKWEDEPPRAIVQRALSEKVSDPMSAWLQHKAVNP